MKKTSVILIIICSFLFIESEPVVASGRDFAVTNLRVDVESGDVWARVKYAGSVPFKGDVYFGIWFNKSMKRPVKRKLIFTNNEFFDIVLCNHDHLQTMSGAGTLKVKVDVTNQYPEADENNNEFQKVLYFLKITSISLTVSPFKCFLEEGEVQKFTFNAKFIVRGRGISQLKFYRAYSRSRIKEGQLGYVLLYRKKTGPYTINVSLGRGQTNTKIKTFSWSTYSSFDVNTKHKEKHECRFQIKAFQPNLINSNRARWIVVYIH